MNILTTLESAGALPFSRPPLEQAAEAAWNWLYRQAERGYPDSTHTLRFPRRQGFRVKIEAQSSDLFARATLANTLLDCAALVDGQAVGNKMCDLARAEADYLARAQLTDRAGGWSYFPGLPELPPDADSLSTISTLFKRVAPEHLALCERPFGLLMQQQRADGSFGTWLIAPEDPGPLRRHMHRGIKRYWRREIDADVIANAIYALRLIDASRFAESISKARQWLATTQHPDGSWPATWYWHHAWPAWLSLRALGCRGSESARARTCNHLAAARNADGGWGPWQTVPLETALAVTVLANEDQARYAPIIAHGLTRLLEMQTPEGHWEGTSWIRMPVPGRSPLSWSSDCIATAVGLRALLGALAQCDAAAAAITTL